MISSIWLVSTCLIRSLQSPCCLRSSDNSLVLDLPVVPCDGFSSLLTVSNQTCISTEFPLLTGRISLPTKKAICYKYLVLFLAYQQSMDILHDIGLVSRNSQWTSYRHRTSLEKQGTNTTLHRLISYCLTTYEEIMVSC